MDVDDPCELRPILIPSKYGSDRRRMRDLGLSLRSGQEGCDVPQDIRITLCSVVEFSGIDEGRLPPVEHELIRKLNVGCARV